MLTKLDNGYRGSCRSIHGVDIGSAIIEGKLKNIISDGGGHAMAGGFSIEHSKLQELKDFFNEKLGPTIEHCINNKEREADLILECKSLSTKLVNEIDKMGPFGAGNHKPKIILKNVVILKIDLIGKNKTNLRLLVADDDVNKLSNSIVAMCFRSGEDDSLYKALKKGDKISLFGEVNINNWMGKQSLQFIIEDFLK